MTDAVVMTEGFFVKVHKITPGGFCGFKGVLCSGVSMVSSGMEGKGVPWVSWGCDE